MNDKVKEIIDKEIDNYCWKDKSNYYYIEIYADYRDELNDNQIKKILECDTKEESQQMFDEIIWDCYSDYGYDYYEELFKNIERELDDNYCELEDEIKDYVYDEVYLEYPSDHYLSKEVYLNLIIDSGDANYDFTCNELFGCNYTKKGIKENSSLVWLMKQQGYTIEQIEKFINDEDFQGSKLLESIYSECLNTSSCMNALVFCFKTSLGNAIDLKDKEGMTIPQHINGGLVDFWNGGGSLLEIKLEKDLIIPKEYIDSITVDGGRGYSIGEIYGMCGSFWKEI